MNNTSAPAQKLRYVACVSYPRSGHHLTVRVLKKYFGDELKYCQFNPAINKDCCQQCPCVDTSVTLTKNHDLDLDRPLSWGLPKSPNTPYLILIRNFLEAVVSDYNMYLRRNDDRHEVWLEYSKKKLRYYERFVRKWVLSHDGIEKLIVSYEDLTANPLGSFRRIIQYFQPSDPIDTERLAEIIESATLPDVGPKGVEMHRNFGVRNRRRIEDFAHYDPKYFAGLERRLSPLLLQTGYRLRYVA
jgi:hypothetical protein